MFMNELISVVVPVYNTNPSDLARCLNAISKQNYTHLEIICVDGGSKQETLDVLKLFSDADSRFKLICAEKGVSNQRNAGIDICSGEYVLFVDSDDYFDTDFVKKIYSRLKENSCDISIPRLVRTEFSEGKLLNKIPYDITDSELYIDDKNYFIYSRSAGLVNPIKLYSKRIIGDSRFDIDSSYGEDLLFNYELAKNGYRTTYCDDALYYYCVNIHSNSATRRLDDKGIKIVESLYLIYKEIRKVDNYNFKGLCKEFSYNFNVFFYAAARLKNKYILRKLFKYKWLYLKLNFSFKNVAYVLFPIMIVKRRNKHA